MQIRPVTARDIDVLNEIDGTIESLHYLHLEEQATDDPPAMNWRIEERQCRQKIIEPNRLSDETLFLIKQIATGADEGLALMAEHEGLPAALIVAKPEPDRGVYSIVDVRIDFEHRRQGVGSALVYQVIAMARQADVRAVAAETLTNHFAGIQMLRKLGFDLSGVDTRRHSNHDVVKESATLFWYLPLSQ